MTPPKMPENNEGIAQGIAEFNLQADCACDISKCHVCQLKDDIKEALDDKDVALKDQLEAGKLAGEALEAIKKQQPSWLVEWSVIDEALLALRKAGCL